MNSMSIWGMFGLDRIFLFATKLIVNEMSEMQTKWLLLYQAGLLMG